MDKNTIPVPTITGEVGLRGTTNTDFSNRTNTATLNWATSAAGGSNAATSVLSNSVFPVSGLTYIWTGPCAVLPVEMSSFISSVNGRDVTLNWTTALKLTIHTLRLNALLSKINGQKLDLFKVLELHFHQ
ncbi:MAG: hypothetical protein IPG02_15765 [Ignavibacteria bacterium]|nr:hypothetical protein [Ignavibacteria bacterium]